MVKIHYIDSTLSEKTKKREIIREHQVGSGANQPNRSVGYAKINEIVVASDFFCRQRLFRQLIYRFQKNETKVVM